MCVGSSVGRASEASETEPRQVGGSSPSPRVERLYAIARADLPSGLRTAQVGHALISWVLEHGAPPENLVVLQVPDEDALHDVHERLSGRVVAFHEPDLGDTLTAVAAGPEAWRALSSLPLLR